jgi:hypothetical protein
MGWFAGPAGVAGVCALGATTAGLQTWIVGKLAIAISENGGDPIPPRDARPILDEARASFSGARESAVNSARRS